MNLYYFNARTGAEHIRFILHSAQIPFEDVRVSLDEWPELKKKMKWGQLPVLEFDDTELFQSAVIGRFLARKYNLVGSSDLDSARCDEYVDIIKDMRAEWEKYFFEDDEAKQAEAKGNLQEIIFPNYLPKLNAEVEANGGKWLVGQTHTWADFFLVNFLEIWEDTVDVNLLKDYPALAANKEAVFQIPGIMEYIKSRPNTPF